jgi:hypothetical protein
VTGDDSTPAAWFDEDDNDGEVTPRGEEQDGEDEEEVNHGALFQIDR